MGYLNKPLLYFVVAMLLLTSVFAADAFPVVIVDSDSVIRANETSFYQLNITTHLQK